MRYAPAAVASVIRERGGALPYRALDSAGVARADVRRALAAGGIRQVRERWFAVPDAHADIVRAVHVGGSLTAGSVARLEGLWSRPDGLLHVRVPRTAGRLWAPDGSHLPLHRGEHHVCVHYRTARTGTPARDPLTLALAELAACAPRLDAIIAIDAALATRRLQYAELPALRSLMMPSRRNLLDLVDGGCQSGTETIVRMLLRSRRLRHRTQVWIDGVGRVDILVGDRLIIEIDGAGFHTDVEFERDRRRDFELVMRGYQVLRLSYSMVMTEWDAVQRGVLDLLDRGEHLWGYRAGPFQRDPTRSIARKHLDPEQ
ncbi:endonuclease domain-containing protein [Agromyces mariniharenae]|uniref:DUF559 domain-containing protein n=1 Tax=Agromyces mariniharenae TaxID=2604423 RepID=A0A5S4V209_9MICO|nr:DUF559 domain-containing protein [Agromyces mariniharenae]TYL53174.1 DUF559 domain-containing protein [Agromyces mariniharenae]